MITSQLKIKKSEIPEHKLFESSYFEIMKNTKIGEDYLKLLPEEIFILMIPFIDINSVIDRCLLNKDAITKKLLKLVYKIQPNIDFNFKDQFEDPIQFLMLEQEIKKIKNYDFAKIYTYVYKFYKTEKTTIEIPDTKIIKKILKLKDKNNNNFILWCTANKKEENFILFLLDNYGKLFCVDNVNSSSTTILSSACHSNMPDVAIKLIDMFDNDCKPEQLDISNNTALIWACEKKCQMSQ